jgi:hypothetical protein
MKLVVIPRQEFSDTHNGKIVKEVYFGNVVANNAVTEEIVEWDPLKTDYQYLDEVVVSSLHTKYTATVDNPVGHPSLSSGWFAEGINAYKISDNLFTSQAIYTQDAIIDFDVTFMTDLFGQNIEHATKVTISKINPDNSTGDEIATIDLMFLESYSCDTCCNPEPVQKRMFHYQIDAAGCIENSLVRVHFTKAETSTYMAIGSLAVGHAYDLGCIQYGASIETVIPKNIREFEDIRQTGVYPANIEKTISANVRIKYSKVDDIQELIHRHGSFLNFYVFDEKDAVKSGFLLGRCHRFMVPINSSDYALIPIEAFGIQN